MWLAADLPIASASILKQNWCVPVRQVEFIGCRSNKSINSHHTFKKMKKAIIITSILLCAILAFAQNNNPKDIIFDVEIKNDTSIVLTTITTETTANLKEELITQSIAKLEADKKQYETAIKQKDAEIATLEELKKKIAFAKKRAKAQKKKKE
jgi:hypothetical protein